MWNTHDALKEKLKSQYEKNRFEGGLEYPVLKDDLYARFFTDERLSVARKKTLALCYMLRNSKIDICEDEFFFDKIEYWNKEYCKDIKDVRSVMPVFVWERMYETQQKIAKETDNLHTKAFETQAFIDVMDFGHIAPDWNFLIKRGVVGVIERLKQYQKTCGDSTKNEYYQNGIEVYEAIVDYLLRVADLAESKGGEKMCFMADNLRQLTKTAPQTLAQGMQLTLLFYTILKDLESTGIRSLGGLDGLYYPLYKADLESERFTEAQLRELTRDFLWKISAMNIPQNTPCYIGGRTENGEDKTNEYTMVLLEEYRALDIYNPKIHVLYHENINPKVLRFILETIREGNNSFVFCNLDVISRSFEKLGITAEDAKKVIVYGCYEPAVEGMEVPCAGGATLNLAKAVELALFNGKDPKTGIAIGLPTGEEFASFDEFYEAVKKQLTHLVEACAGLLTKYEAHYPNICPTPILSATYRHSVEQGVGLFEGGAKYNNTSIIGAGIATATDSVVAVKKLVFEEKKISFSALKKCLLADFEEYQDVLRYTLNEVPKYGNNNKETDDIAVDLFKVFSNLINNRKNGRGGVFRCGLFSITTRIPMGAAMIATPDGRRNGKPLSKNLGATAGQDKEGVTALLQTQLRFDATQIADGTVSDILLHTSAVKGEDGLLAFEALLKTYMQGGGFAIHFNVLNKEVLQKAQAEPEKYRNLQVRLCGWNVYFVDLNKQEQDDFILQASVNE